MDRFIAQATGHNNYINVYEDRVEIVGGWQGQNVENLDLKEISSVNVRGVVNCTLELESNKGRAIQVTRLARPDAQGIKKAIEDQKEKAGLYE